MELVGVLESLLFVAGDEGLSLKEMMDVLELSEDKLKDLLEELISEFNQKNHGIMLEHFGNKYKFVTKKINKGYLQKMVEMEENEYLSQSALETLAIIAYNEPITRTSIDAIRGVNSSYVVRKLVLKEMIKEVGKSDLPGRPILYGTTDRFLDYFGLSSKDDLPNLNIVDKVDLDETNLFDSKYKEV